MMTCFSMVWAVTAVTFAGLKAFFAVVPIRPTTQAIMWLCIGLGDDYSFSLGIEKFSVTNWNGMSLTAMRLRCGQWREKMACGAVAVVEMRLLT